MHKQLALDFRLQDFATFGSFYIGKNTELVNSIKKNILHPSRSVFYLWGSSGSGCSHLLQAACHAAPGSLYLPLNNLVGSADVELLDNLETAPLVCLDNIEVVVQQLPWQQQIFNLFNALRDNGNNIMVASNCSAASLNLELQDLKSRLAWGVSYKVQQLTDAEKISALQLRAHARGLELSNKVGKYLVEHLPRNMSELFSGLEQLDKASMVEQRKLTIPFVKQVLNLGGCV